eukprot:CAMPEP_0172843272 /NCGR_PEP_ID=MMETSP1075-20121228/31342_1 /TAXON_ID=2916 /ORGANISM="Ceratium fusus, Strain PA161109" /LENGTH=35 /DNA_ID= /DNA_START= /DNA_END= /DNA_ORIENTATION=
MAGVQGSNSSQQVFWDHKPAIVYSNKPVKALQPIF